MHSNVRHANKWETGLHRASPSSFIAWPQLSVHSTCHPWGARHVCCSVKKSSATHYQVLGVAPSATPTDIKSAYRRLARQLHPDVNKDPAAPAQFVQCNTAYEILSDDAKRREYDMELAMRSSHYSATSFTGAGFGGMGGTSVWEFVSEVMADEFRSSGSAGRGAARSGRRHVDEEEEGGLTEEEMLYEMDYKMWSATASNYRASFTSSWSGANGRKRRAAAEARAQKAAAEARTAEQARKTGKAGRGSAQRLDRETVEDVLNSFGPEVKLTAQRTFGRNLEGLTDVQELMDFVEVMNTLRDDMGIPFEIFHSNEAFDTYHRTSSSKAEPSSSRGSSSSAGGRRAGAASASPAPSAGAGRAPRGSSVGPGPAAGRSPASSPARSSVRSAASGSEKVKKSKKGKKKGNAKGSIAVDDPWYYGEDADDGTAEDGDADDWMAAWSSGKTSRASSRAASSTVFEPTWKGPLPDPFGDLFK